MNMDEVNVEEGFKRCSKCGRILPLSEFYKDKRANDGLRSACKACSRAKVAQYYQSNKDSILKKAADYYQENKDAILKKAADYYQENKDAILKHQAEYYQASKEAILKKQAEYSDAQKNPLGWAKRMVKGYRKMDRDRGFDDSKTISAEWFLKNIAYKPCAHCGLLKVGAIGANRLNNNIGHEASNLEPCCMPCNSREGVRYQIARGLHCTCKHKKQSFSDFVDEHKAKHKKD